MSKGKKRISTATKYLVLACTFLLAINLVLGIVLTSQSKKGMTALLQSKMLDAANIAAASMDGDLMASISSQDAQTGSENFQKVLSSLRLFLDHMDMKYIYAVKHVSGQSFVFLADPDPIDPGQFGEPIVYTKALEKASQGIASVDENPFSDRWGKFYSAYSPVYDSEGNLVCIIGVDYDAAWFEDMIAMHTASILIICTLSVLIGAFIVLLISNRFQRRFRILSDELSSLSDEVNALNKEMAPPEEFHAKPSRQPAEAEEDSPSHVGTFDALENKIKQTRQDMRQYASYVHEQDFTDPLTGVGNKMAYQELTRDMDLKIADGVADFCIAMFDVDGLRQINDEYGLNAGDQVIFDTATLLLQAFRPETIFRIGSDEFIVLAQDFTAKDLEHSLNVIETAQRKEKSQKDATKQTPSLAKGVAFFDAKQDHSCNDVLKRANKMLKQNKAASK
ncbi:MAG: diguanylate cyclase [Lachnospiraceae bacterium]|nr:diguanylate cyclase [Lachnospiraceae bacterium]MBR4607227.1 diguanylate cyclase [Lachnospiraceae bacterium]